MSFNGLWLEKKILPTFLYHWDPCIVNSILHKGELWSLNCDDHSFRRGTDPLPGAGAAEGLRPGSSTRPTARCRTGNVPSDGARDPGIPLRVPFPLRSSRPMNPAIILVVARVELAIP